MKQPVPKVVKYMNLNSFPVSLPDGRGGQVMFRPGEGTTKSWFSRLCGPNQLTKIDPNILSFSARKPAPAKPVSSIKLPPETKIPAPVKPPVQIIPVTKPVAHDVETADYTFRHGVYRCKKCDVFMTGSNEALQMHIAQVHQQRINKPVVSLGQSDNETERVVASTKLATPRKADEEKEEVRKSIPRSPVKPVTKPKAEEKPVEVPVEQPVEKAESAPEKGPKTTFACQHPGCGKVFASEKGLKMHTMRVHKEK